VCSKAAGSKLAVAANKLAVVNRVVAVDVVNRAVSAVKVANVGSVVNRAANEINNLLRNEVKVVVNRLAVVKAVANRVAVVRAVPKAVEAAEAVAADVEAVAVAEDAADDRQQI
jgi:hypothetical protein